MEEHEEQSGHALFVAGDQGFARPFPAGNTEPADASRRIPERDVAENGPTDQLQPFHEDVSAGSLLERVSASRRTSSETFADSLPVSPTQEQLQEENASLPAPASPTKEQLKEENASLKRILAAKEEDSQVNPENEDLRSYVTFLEAENDKLSRLLDLSKEDRDLKEDELRSLKQSYERLKQQAVVGASPLFQGADTDDSLLMILINYCQAHLPKLRCWGCFEACVMSDRSSSHGYGKAILIAAAAFCLERDRPEVNKSKLDLFWLHGKPCLAAQCVLPVKSASLCETCDASTSEWEKALVNKFGQERIFLEKKCDGVVTVKEDITELALLMQVIRAAMMTIDLHHMLHTCSYSWRYYFDVLQALLSLAKVHHTVCKEFAGRTKQDEYCSKLEVVREKCTEVGLNPTIRRSVENTHDHLIEYPLVAIVQDLGPVIYAQIPPYYIAVPTREHSARIGNDLMGKIITQVNVEMYGRREHFYEGEGAQNWKDKLITKKCRPMMVYQEVREDCTDTCCIHVS